MLHCPEVKFAALLLRVQRPRYPKAVGESTCCHYYIWEALCRAEQRSIDKPSGLRGEDSVADDHGGGEHGDEEERDLDGLVRLEQLLHPFRSPERRRRLVAVVLGDEVVLLHLLVRDQAHLGVARDESVEGESATWWIGRPENAWMDHHIISIDQLIC